MKKSVLIICALAAVSCVKKYEGTPPATPSTATLADVQRLQTAEEFQIPVKEGYVTQVVMNGEVMAEAATPMTTLLPKAAESDKVELNFVPNEKYPNYVNFQNSSKLYQVVCFEDSRKNVDTDKSDYDYNDLVIHVLYMQRDNIFGFGVHPIALGSTKPIKLGAAVYKGETLVWKGLITPEGKDCRAQYFEGQTEKINTFGNKINQQNGGWNIFLGSSIRNFDISKIEAEGAMRVEWYIVVDDGKAELYALSTQNIDKSFDINKKPYGLVITDTGATYNLNGIICGKDWFNYPQEGRSISEVYPEIWEWMTNGNSFVFSEIYNGKEIPDGAYDASGLGLYISTDADVCRGGNRVNL